MLIKLLPKDAAQKDLFDLYDNFLNEILSENDLELTLRNFELDLLDMLGYGIDFENEIDNNSSIQKDEKYLFISEKGFKKSEKGNLTGEDIINIKNRNLVEVSKNLLKEITTRAIGFCLDGKELSSRQIFKSLRS